MRNGADTIVRAFTGARSLWQHDVKMGNGSRHRLELIALGKTTILVHDYPNGDGWQVYAPVTEDGRIEATLQAIAERCGVEPPSHVFEEDKKDAARVYHGEEDIAHCVKCGQAEDRQIHRV